MRLVVDTSVLVGELLRAAGRIRLGDERLELFLPEQMWGETQVELPRRITAFVRRRGLEPSLGDELATACLAAVDANRPARNSSESPGSGTGSTPDSRKITSSNPAVP